MDKDLLTRVGLVIATVVLYLIATRVDFYPTVVAPVAVIVVAVIMFWPRRSKAADTTTTSTREEIRHLREETQR
ncbi:hypothetical protein CGLAU_08480 [Corynebacterium glaucum]|uniref:Uncharacterized protein n=1 Tax=Corynebacterium glaucum TaxID=187491 RepID=A0A1Q2HXS5_9CORY|nr:hypothetical protein [Corynebacterium glaucum]AQQ15651.1 hypothetical protein CGLAU_08480 [Corynebacterium glaucum]WJZ08155.1 hypothetical protein CGLAUT_08370 [Corynebacterium glaucum]